MDVCFCQEYRIRGVRRAKAARAQRYLSRHQSFLFLFAVNNVRPKGPQYAERRNGILPGVNLPPLLARRLAPQASCSVARPMRKGDSHSATHLWEKSDVISLSRQHRQGIRPCGGQMDVGSLKSRERARLSYTFGLSGWGFQQSAISRSSHTPSLF